MLIEPLFYHHYKMKLKCCSQDLLDTNHKIEVAQFLSLEGLDRFSINNN